MRVRVYFARYFLLLKYRLIFPTLAYQMTNEQQTEYWRKFSRFQQRYEAIFVPVFNRAIQLQYKQYTDSGTIMAVDSIPIYAALKSLYNTVSPLWAAASTVDIRSMKTRAPIGFSARIVELMQQYYGIDLLNDADGITQTTKDLIQRVLGQAAAEGFGFDEVVRRLSSPDLTRARARLIARTETVRAANAASNVAASETKLLMDKIWISARDARVRVHHREVNQKVVGMNDRFTVGADHMLFPGDRAGSAAEVVNCRCTHAFIPKRDSNGRLIRV